MKVSTLLDRLGEGTLSGDETVQVRGITHDSRRVSPGAIFAAIPGTKTHGASFVGDAIEAGAAAVLSDRDRPARIRLPWIRVKNARPTMARAAWILAGNPQRKLGMIGVTGTNGKSTTAHLISQILNSAGCPTVFVGTLGVEFPDGTEIDSARTTPEATDLAPILKQAVKVGVANVAMEVSSHALCQDRVAGIEFNVAVWTNLTRDHLDYHGDMESYYEAKRRLFTEHLAKAGRRVLPVDDPWGARLLDDQQQGDISWGLDRGAVCARTVISDLEGSRFNLRLPETELPVRLPLVGVHNLRNGLAAAAAASAAGLSAKAIRQGLKRAKPLSGRLERVTTKLGFPVFVDYAHTPEGLRSVLQALDRVTDRQIIVVFGAGGDRDRGKRAAMGYAAGELGDVQIVTTDNPRTEDPGAIAEEVAEGALAAGGRPRIVLDRHEAIRTALEMATERSLVLVAGKGHESVQIIGDEEVPFSDHDVIRREARRLQ